MSLTKQDLQSIGNLMDQKFSLFEKKINKNTDKKIEDLARLTARGFDEVNDKFNKVNSKFDEVDKKIGSEVGSLCSEMHLGFSKVYSEINDVKEKVDRINQRTLDDENVLAGDIVDLQKRVKKLEPIKTC